MTETSDEPAIVTDGLTKEYGDTTAVDDLTIAIDPGTVYGFLGPNGAGKTTTIRLLTALVSPTGGSGRVAGAPITDREAIIDHIGYLPESPPIRETLTAREQLQYHGGLRDMDPAELEGRIESLLERFDLADDADDRIVTYSKGMRQKTGLIQAIMHEPDVVFLDEPTSGLDPRAARTVRETIADLAANGTTVFLSTHALPVVDELADVVGVLYEGSLVAEGDPKTLASRAERGDATSLEDAFLEITGDLRED
ncbi:ABC transporter ATP-binding protein [Natrinema versiforme]|uniref:ABC transporter ATP-binding protein n=1 Tax=Natrinema versiforme TaxID=88724 RepID=A0A4P8WIT4_9EURY|nr:ABC transporter ATP-binding protein [Natrinema versiforme]QCS42982.1 ABC transporter ATP-binding protein [Natrinema versiforme]